MGNLASVKNAFSKLGFEAAITSSIGEILEAERVVLPGVGAFEDAIANLRQLGLDKVIAELVRRDTPLLGICLGLQMLFTESEENGIHQGLDIIKGRVVKFELPAQFKVPHMGWNQVKTAAASRLFNDIPANSHFYFVHSYYVAPEDHSCIAGTCDYGRDFVCAVEQRRLFATQFHPEKSSEMGLRILKNFGEI